MNHNLIDMQILELLRIPANQRTQERVAFALTAIAQAAESRAPVVPQLEQSAKTTMQQEQIKLAALTEFLRQELGFDYCSVTLDINQDNYKQNDSLTTFIGSDEGDNFMVGRGLNAESALRDLHTIAKPKKAI